MEVTTSTVFVAATKPWISMHIYWSTPWSYQKSAKGRAAFQIFSLSGSQNKVAELYIDWETNSVAILSPYAEDILSPKPLSEVHVVQSNHQFCKNSLMHTHTHALLGIQSPSPARKVHLAEDFYLSLYFWELLGLEPRV